VTFDALGGSTQLTATARDASGTVVTGGSFNWTSTDPLVATVNSGTVTAVANGQATIRATADGVSGEASVTVQQVAVAVTVSPTSATLLPGATLQLTAAPVDANGNGVSGLTVTWTTSNQDIATVDGSGLVTAGSVSLGPVTITANADGQGSGEANVEVATTFASVSAGGQHTCAISGSMAFCWGVNLNGELGRPGSTTDTCGGIVCRKTPTTVEGGLSFASVSRGSAHTCGTTTGDAAFCWGFNSSGQLGDGSTISATQPVAVGGGHLFGPVAIGDEHSCAIRNDGETVCWGKNDLGQFGDASTDNATSPTLVSGSHAFVALTAGISHSCGLTGAGDVYCWGRNDIGQLGASTSETCGGMSCSTTPVLVSGGYTFAAVSAGSHHTCGVASGGDVYCWGYNSLGQLGTATVEMCSGFPCSSAPIAVATALQFNSVSAGDQHTCAVDGVGAAHCWGSNVVGQLGSGSTTSSTVPIPVSGGLSFSAVSAGGSHTCGLAVGGVLYCWGQNGNGQLGIGSTDDQLEPQRVLGQP
jgi:alpha-tubulin suppressor-like RCC1 family protein